MNLHIAQNHNIKNESIRNGLLAPMTTLYRSGGLVSEINYDQEQPFVLHLLLPFLQQLAEQPRWQLWLTPQQKLSRQWLMNVGLPESKIVQIPKADPINNVEAMEKALASGNFSAVLAWIPNLSADDKERLQRAAEIGNAYGFIMNPHNSPLAFAEPLFNPAQSANYH